MTDLCLGSDLHHDLLGDKLDQVQDRLWIATADIKDMHVKRGRRFVPFLRVLNDLVHRGVGVRLLHAKEPGPRFRRDFDRFPALLNADLFERALCPRVHMKMILLDGTTAYVGSANLTGAGMGGRSENKRNFEAGVMTTERRLVKGLEEYFDKAFRGGHCPSCRFRASCPDPIA